MKNIFTMCCAVIMALAMVGCDDTPLTTDQVKTIAYPVGLAAGKVVTLTVTDATVQTKIVEVLNTVEKSVPSTNETFVAVWTPLAQELVDKYIADGKLNETQGKLVMTGCKAGFTGLDYLFSKNKKIKDSADLVSTAVHSFIDGFSTAIAPKSDETLSAEKMDKDAFEFIKNAVK